MVFRDKKPVSEPAARFSGGIQSSESFPAAFPGRFNLRDIFSLRFQDDSIFGELSGAVAEAIQAGEIFPRPFLDRFKPTDFSRGRS